MVIVWLWSYHHYALLLRVDKEKPTHLLENRPHAMHGVCVCSFVRACIQHVQGLVPFFSPPFSPPL